MKKLFVAGCSFSDFTKVEKVYGQFLSEKLNYEYVHEGAGCGSNWRIWRQITKHIMSGNLTSNDLLIVQYSGREREEFWSALEQPSYSFRPNTVDHLTIIDKYTDGNIIRYKANSHTWQNNKEERDLFELYEKYFVNIDFENERFTTQNYMFQTLLLSKHIPVIFVRSHRIPPLVDADIFTEYMPYVFDEPYKLKQYNLEPNDYGHMNQAGHQVFADWLFEHINTVYKGNT
jgi:hypothetical protein